MEPTDRSPRFAPRHSRRAVVAAVLVSASALVQPQLASADVVPLADGRILHGELLADRSGDEEGLAVRVYETGGTVLVSWDHVLPEEAKAIRLRFGIDTPPEDDVSVPGHTLTLTDGTTVVGVLENPGGDPLRLKTASGIQPYAASRVGGVAERSVPILQAYTVAEAYQWRLSQGAPADAAGHFDVAKFCMAIGDFDNAVSHLGSAASDEGFGSTADGRRVPQMIKRAEILREARGASDLVAKIKRSMFQRKWNDALEQLKQLDGDYQDERIRKEIGFDRVRNMVEKGREKYFRRRVQQHLHTVMKNLISSKVKEKKSLRDDDESPGAAVAGTMAGAKQWALREMPEQLWKKLTEDLGLTEEEIDHFWKMRSSKRTRTATYGTGSFAVLDKKSLPRSQGPRRRPPGSRRGGGGNSRAPGPQKESKPLTDEQWWGVVTNGAKTKWVTAYVAQNSGIFDVIRTDENDLCANCAGKGILTSSTSDGGSAHAFCPQCNGGGHELKVIYR